VLPRLTKWAGSGGGDGKTMTEQMASARPAIAQDQAPDLYILGAGVSFPEHLTMQTLQILEGCNRICSNLPQDELNKLPENLRAKCVSLWPLYQENRARSQNYIDVAETVLAATARERPVAWLTPGHPLIFDSVSQALLDAGPKRGFRVGIGAAISCIDTVLSQLGYDPANGLTIQDATSLVMRNLPLDPSLATLLFQPSAFGTMLTHYQTRWSPDLSPLRNHLRKFYPANHRCAFVRSYSPQGGSAQVAWCTLDELTAAPFDVVAGTTLFLPALSTAPEADMRADAATLSTPP
jgi:Tetrapyrrole (Corrin/Porphyrin) Methylases